MIMFTQALEMKRLHKLSLFIQHNVNGNELSDDLTLSKHTLWCDNINANFSTIALKQRDRTKKNYLRSLYIYIGIYTSDG